MSCTSMFNEATFREILLPTGNHMFKVINRNTEQGMKYVEHICSTYISNLVLVFLLLTLSR